MHLPKTGGSSVLSALKKHLPESAIHTLAYGTREDADNLDLAVFREKRLLHGHFSAKWVGMFNRSTAIAVCLREPLATTRSIYTYFLAFRPEELSGRQALIRKSAEGGFKSYLRFLRTERSSQYYLHYLDPLYGAPGSTTLEGASIQKSVARAKHFLDRCEIVGVTEKVDAFVRTILSELEIDAGRIEVEPVNVSANLAREFPGRFLPVDEDDGPLDEEAEGLLQEINRPLDDIYQHARALAEQRAG